MWENTGFPELRRSLIQCWGLHVSFTPVQQQGGSIPQNIKDSGSTALDQTRAAQRFAAQHNLEGSPLFKCTIPQNAEVCRKCLVSLFIKRNILQFLHHFSIVYTLAVWLRADLCPLSLAGGCGQREGEDEPWSSERAETVAWRFATMVNLLLQ